MAERLEFLATTPRGVEALLARELEQLGAARVRQRRGGVAFHAQWREVAAVCVRTRLAMRVLRPLGEWDVAGAEALYDAVYALRWEEHLALTSTFAVDATVKDSVHTHSGFVALKVKDAIVDAMRRASGGRPNVDTAAPDVRVVVHLARTRLSVSLDLTGAPLSRRGYRVAPTRATLNQTLAAALLAASGYTGEEPFADPMCGSGTLCIEAAQLAQRIAPGLARTFGMERWPALGPQIRTWLEDAREACRSEMRPLPAPVWGRDRDEEAIAAAKSNARASGVKGIQFEAADVLASPPPAAAQGLIVTNPPYGDRLAPGGQKGMKTFYFQLGEALARWRGWRLGVLCGNEAFESAFHRRPVGRLPLWNGPIACQFFSYPAPG